MTINAVELSFAEWQTAIELARQREVATARDYFDSTTPLAITDEMLSLLGASSVERVRYRLNVIRPIIHAVTERMGVESFHCDDATREWAWNTWQANRMDVNQDDVYAAAENEGEAFVLVDWDEQNARARWIMHPRYVDPKVGGDGFGCKATYENDDPNQPLVRVSKRWRELLGGGKARLRLTAYYPDRIEKYEIADGGGLNPFRDEGDTAWPIPWLSGDGEPLGVPVIHFTTPGERPGAYDAWGLQDALTNSLMDLVANNRLAAFRIFKMFGFYPTSDGRPPAADGSNAPKLRPGSILHSSKGPADAAADVIEGADSAPFLNVLRELVIHAATVTDTPVARFQITGQIAAEGTLKQQSEPLMAKIEKRQMRLGDKWEECLYMSRKLEALYGSAKLDPAENIQTLWKPVEKRSIQDKAQEADAKIKSKVPEETVWREVWGYTEEQIAGMKSEASYQARQQMIGNAFNVTAQNG